MSMTLQEIKDRLMQLDEVTLLEVLNLSSEDIVEAFEDVVVDRFEEFEDEFAEEE